MKIWLPLLLLVPLLTLCAAQEESAPRVIPTVTIGAWNLEWLGTPGRRKDARGNDLALRSGPEIERIAALVSEFVDYEVIVLVEINVESRGWSRLKGALAAEGFEFLAGSGGDQRVVVAYDSEEVQLRNSFEPDLSTEFSRADRFGSGRCEAGGRRPLFANLVAGDFDFTIVGVHLKSMFQPRDCDDPTFTAFVRGRQMTEIADEIERRGNSLSPRLIIAGDFNALPGDPGLTVAAERGFRLLSDAAHRSPSSGGISYRKGPHISQLDHIAVRPDAAEWWLQQSTTLLPAFSTMSDQEMDRWRRTYSDHAPVWAEFRRLR